MSERLIRRRDASRGLYVDLEGRAVPGEPPVLLGVLYEDDEANGGLILRQLVIDPAFRDLARDETPNIEPCSIEESLEWLLDLSSGEQRPVISWSRYDRNLIKELTSDRAFRYRNAIATAKRWARSSEEVERPAVNELRAYEKLIGYERPPELHRVGESLAYIRRLRSVTDGARQRWTTIVAHNEHDLRSMREVVLHVRGIAGQ